MTGVRVVLLKILDNPAKTDDAAGDLLKASTLDAGHSLVANEQVVSNESAIVEALKTWTNNPEVDCVITYGGTGFGPHDVTPEALAQVWDREIVGFGEIFRAVSFGSIGSSAIQSRACAGLVGRVVVFAVPGSPGAVRDAWSSLIGPQLDARTKPCNLVEHLNCGHD